MPEGRDAVRHCRILIVEDEFLIAEELREAFEDLGAVVVGPVATVDAALAIIGSGEPLDGATLDISLGREKSFPVVEALLERDLPVVLLTGYGEGALPEHLRHVPRCEKPFNLGKIVQALFH
jgi:CheY-like chemotaxis protein